MTFEEWFVRSGWLGFGSAVEIAANDGYNAGYKQAIVDCYGEAAAPLVLESLRKALNRPVEPFTSGGEGQGSQTQVAQPPAGHFLPDFGGKAGHWQQCKFPIPGSVPLYAAPQVAQPLKKEVIEDAYHRACKAANVQPSLAALDSYIAGARFAESQAAQPLTDA